MHDYVVVVAIEQHLLLNSAQPLKRPGTHFFVGQPATMLLTVFVKPSMYNVLFDRSRESLGQTTAIHINTNKAKTAEKKGKATVLTTHCATMAHNA